MKNMDLCTAGEFAYVMSRLGGYLESVDDLAFMLGMQKADVETWLEAASWWNHGHGAPRVPKWPDGWQPVWQLMLCELTARGVTAEELRTGARGIASTQLLP